MAGTVVVPEVALKETVEVEGVKLPPLLIVKGVPVALKIHCFVPAFREEVEPMVAVAVTVMLPLPTEVTVAVAPLPMFRL